MRASLPLAVCLFALTASPSAARVDVTQCASITGQAVYRGLGYDHVVEVDNQCPKAVQCELWTDVDPQPRHALRVEAGESGSVVTRLGSPSRTFTAQGECRF